MPCDGARSGRDRRRLVLARGDRVADARGQLERHADGRRRERRAACGPSTRPRSRRRASCATIATGETGWFSSPGLVDLDGDGKLEIVAPSTRTFVFDAERAACSARARRRRAASTRRASSPTSTATSVPEIVVGGNEGTVAAYDLVGGRLQLKPGWPASTCSGGQCPEARGMAAADLDGDGRVEVVVTTTNTSPTGSQVFVFDAAGSAVPARGGGRDGVAALQHALRAGQRRRLQRRRQPRLRRLRRERRHRQPRRRPAARDRRHLRQPPDQRLQPRRHARCWRRRGSPTARTTTSARAWAGGSSSAG